MQYVAYNLIYTIIYTLIYTLIYTIVYTLINARYKPITDSAWVLKNNVLVSLE